MRKKKRGGGQGLGVSPFFFPFLSSSSLPLSFPSPSPHVAFCGYSNPHPSEKVVNLRIQTTGDISAAAALRQAAVDLKAAALALRDTFASAVEHGEAGAPVQGAPPAVRRG